jgi:hypothetical protein
VRDEIHEIDRKITWKHQEGMDILDAPKNQTALINVEQLKKIGFSTFRDCKETGSPN